MGIFVEEDKEIPRPCQTFEESPFSDAIKAKLKEQGFEAPTGIQAQGWPIAAGGQDLVGIAETGSGKTLAFLLPALVHIKAQPEHQEGDGPIVLVLSPTRELACQILE